MTAKKKKGIGFILSGVAFLIVGIFSIKGSVPPSLGQIFSIVGLVANAVGIAFVYPDEVK